MQKTKIVSRKQIDEVVSLVSKLQNMTGKKVMFEANENKQTARELFRTYLYKLSLTRRKLDKDKVIKALNLKKNEELSYSKNPFTGIYFQVDFYQNNDKSIALYLYWQNTGQQDQQTLGFKNRKDCIQFKKDLKKFE